MGIESVEILNIYYYVFGWIFKETADSKDFLDLQKSSREDTDLLQILIRILLKHFLWEWLNNLKLAVLVIEAQIFLHQRPYIAVEHGHFVSLQEASFKLLACALGSENDLRHVISALFRLIWHFFNYCGCALTALELNGSRKLFFVLLPQALLFLFLGFAPLLRSRGLSLDLLELVLHLGLLILLLLFFAQ